MPRLLISEHIASARDSLKSTRGRTILTILGIAIGVASMTTILTLSSGVNKIIDRQIKSLGDNLAIVQPALPAKGANTISDFLSQQTFSTSTLSENDYTEITKLPGVKAAAPIMTLTGSPKAKNTTVANSTVFATTPSFTDTANIPIQEPGQFIDSVTNRDTAVIGPQLAIDLFGTEAPIGQTFDLRGQTFTIIGVLKRQNQPVNINNIDFDRSLIISLEAAKSFHEGMSQIQQINITAKDVNQLPEVVNKVDALLAKNHHGEKDFTIAYSNHVAPPSNHFLEMITASLATIAGVSLIVGGVGIMNIMLVGVAERTREIGLRKAVGATKGSIIAQFMTESLIMSFIGGVLGVAGGYLVAFILSTFLTLMPDLTWQIALYGIGIAVVVGVIFGLYPAIRAANKDPISSLRLYH